MKKYKKIIGYSMLVLFIPVTLGLCTIDGTFVYHGHTDKVIPFLGGFIIGLALDLMVVIVLCFFRLIIYFIHE